MSTPARHHRYTYEEYRRLEDESDVRHEYLDGDIYAMAGGTPEHAAKAGDIVGILRAQLPRGCRVYTSDLRVRIPASGLSTYPDAAVICGAVLRASDDPLAAVNPVLLAEVTSSSTEDYDRGVKLEHYKKLPSLSEVLIASHREPLLTLHRREGDTWRTASARPGESLRLTSIGASVAVDEVYRDEFEGGAGR
jgi:Uma2 family endonuclease